MELSFFSEDEVAVSAVLSLLQETRTKASPIVNKERICFMLLYFGL
jgi:hypothetical protein